MLSDEFLAAHAIFPPTRSHFAVMGVDTPEWAVRGHTGGFWSLVGVSWRGGKGTRVGADEVEEPDEDIVVHLKPSIFLQMSWLYEKINVHRVVTKDTPRRITRPGLC